MSDLAIVYRPSGQDSYYYQSDTDTDCGSAAASPTQVPSGFGDMDVLIGSGKNQATFYVYNGSSSGDLVWKGLLDAGQSYWLEDGAVYPNANCSPGGCTYDSSPLAACDSGSGSGAAGGGGGGGASSRMWLWILIIVAVILVAGGGWWWIQKKGK